MKLGWRRGGGCLGGDEEDGGVKARVLLLVKRNERKGLK